MFHNDFTVILQILSHGHIDMSKMRIKKDHDQNDRYFFEFDEYRHFGGELMNRWVKNNGHFGTRERSF